MLNSLLNNTKSAVIGIAAVMGVLSAVAGGGYLKGRAVEKAKWEVIVPEKVFVTVTDTVEVPVEMTTIPAVELTIEMNPVIRDSTIYYFNQLVEKTLPHFEQAFSGDLGIPDLQYELFISGDMRVVDDQPVVNLGYDLTIKGEVIHPEPEKKKCWLSWGIAGVMAGITIIALI